MLLSKGVPVDARHHRGTPLHLAAANGHEKTVKILLDHHVDPSSVCLHVFTPLSLSVVAGSLPCTKLLIEAGADLNVNNSTGVSLLGLAADDGYTEFIKCLVEAGANPNIPDEDYGNTASAFLDGLKLRLRQRRSKEGAGV